MKRIIIIYLLLPLFLYSQETWIKTYAPFGSGEDIVYYSSDLVICQDGGYAMNGYYYIEDEFGNWLEYLGLLMKVDSDGNFLWAKRDTVSFLGITESQAFVETSDGGFLSAVYKLADGTVLIKRDSEGNREWNVYIEDYYIRSMDNTEDGNIITAGSMQGSLHTIKKINENADILWSKSYEIEGYQYGSFQSLKQSNDFGYLIAGRIRNQDTYYDAFVVKTNENGDTLWTKIYDIYNDRDQFNSIAENSNNKICAVGRARNPGYRQSLGLVTLLDENGNEEWVEICSGNVIWEKFCIISLPDNTFSASGPLYNFDEDYNINWISEHGGGSENGIKFIENEGYIFPGGRETMDQIGLTKTDINGYVNSINDNNIIKSDQSYFVAYPNPFNISTTISFHLEHTGLVDLDIYNVRGKLVRNIINTELNSGRHEIEWNGISNNGTELASGLYFIKLSQNNKTFSQKKIILLK